MIAGRDELISGVEWIGGVCVESGHANRVVKNGFDAVRFYGRFLRGNRLCA
jgi:hypothetical protein